MAKAVIIGRTYIQKMIDAGLVPAKCRRIIIDAHCEEVVKLYYECYGDERLLQLELPSGLDGVNVIRAVDMGPKADEPTIALKQEKPPGA